MDKTNRKFNFFLKTKFFIFLTLFFLLLPEVADAALASLLASIGAFVLGTATTILTASAIIILILQLFLLVAGLINTALAALIGWIISPGAVGWSYTNPVENPFIRMGLEITGGFVSMGLILALVAIAFATILRLEGWDTKRLLVRLIIAALLVYFAPVICGLIVDATNIFMWYFADRIGGLGVLTSTFLTVVLNIVRAFLGIPILQQVNVVAASIIQLIFQIYLALVLLGFFLLFTFRHVAIWIAVILSPIAFICWILPVTKRYWDWWWRNFIQWALAGPITAFFLYLGARAAQEVAIAPWVAPLQGLLRGITRPLEPLGQIIPYLFPIGILNLGIILGIQGAGVGADLALKWAQRGVGWARGKLEPWGRRMLTPAGIARTGMATAGLIFGPERAERWMERLRRWGERQATLPLPGAEVPGRRGMLLRGAAWPVWALRRKVGELVGPAQIEAERREVEMAEAAVKGKSVELQSARLQAARTRAQRLGILQAMILDRNLREAADFLEALSTAERNALFRFAERIGKGRILRAAFPNFAREYVATYPGAPGALPLPVVVPPGLTLEQYAAQHIMRRVRPEDFEHMTERVLRDPEIIEALIYQDSPTHFEAFIRRFGREGAEAFERQLLDMTQRPAAQGRNPAQLLAYLAPRLYNYLLQPARRARLLVRIPGMR